MKKYTILTLLLMLTSIAASPQPLLAAPTLRMALGPFDDVSASNLAYKYIARLEKIGAFNVQSTGTSSGRRTMTRYEFAVFVWRVAPYVEYPKLFNTRPADSRDIGWQPAVLHNAEALLLVGLLCQEFSREVHLLGVDVPAFDDRLASLQQAAPDLHKATAFPDVLPAHRAAASVLELRTAGLVIGYPDGKFN